MHTVSGAIRMAVMAAASLFPLSAISRQMAIPADAPPAYQTECGSCHIAYLPALLQEPEWRVIMAQLDRHYGDNASLDNKTRQQIEDFLARNAGKRWFLSFGFGDPPRLTETAWFHRKHRSLSGRVWSDKRVGRASNCAACHPDAGQGFFSKHDLTVPPGFGGGD